MTCKSGPNPVQSRIGRKPEYESIWSVQAKEKRIGHNGKQYPVTPLLITEHQWQISGIETPFNKHKETVHMKYFSHTIDSVYGCCLFLGWTVLTSNRDVKRHLQTTLPDLRMAGSGKYGGTWINTKFPSTSNCSSTNLSSWITALKGSTNISVLQNTWRVILPDNGHTISHNKV